MKKYNIKEIKKYLSHFKTLEDAYTNLSDNKMEEILGEKPFNPYKRPTSKQLNELFSNRQPDKHNVI